MRWRDLTRCAARALALTFKTTWWQGWIRVRLHDEMLLEQELLHAREEF